MLIGRRWIGIAVVALLVGAVLAAKQSERFAAPPGTIAGTGKPQILLVADMREAGGDDGCARIIEAVQVAQRRHIKVVQFGPGEKSELIASYHVLVVPTVLILEADGVVAQRFEGESPEIVSAVESHLSHLQPLPE